MNQNKKTNDAETEWAYCQHKVAYFNIFFKHINICCLIYRTNASVLDGPSDKSQRSS